MQFGDTHQEVSASHMTAPKNFQKAINELVSANVYDHSMVALADQIAAERASMEKSGLKQFLKTTNRLWECHEQHLGRIEKLREQMEQERFERGGNPDQLDMHCTFQPELVHDE